MQLLTGTGVFRTPPAGETNDFTETLSVPDLSVGTYSIPAGGVDNQTPHTEDEIYVVTQGQARIVTPAVESAIGPGDVVFVPAGEPHRFTDITEDLALIVMFGPAYRSRA